MVMVVMMVLINKAGLSGARTPNVRTLHVRFGAGERQSSSFDDQKAFNFNFLVDAEDADLSDLMED